MLTRLMPGAFLATLLAMIFMKTEVPAAPGKRGPDLSERVLFSVSSKTSKNALKRPAEELVPSFEELGFSNSLSVETVEVVETEIAGVAAAGTPEKTLPSVLRLSPAKAFRSAPENASMRKPRSAPASVASSAYASMPPPSDLSGGGADFSDAADPYLSLPSGDLPPHMREFAPGLGGAAGSANYAEQPLSRGIRPYAFGEMTRTTQTPSLADTTAYTMTEKKYSIGLDYDWSVDTVIGAGVEMLDATVTSGQQYDKRITGIDGVLATASMNTVLFDSYLLGLKGCYGRLDNAGSGTIGDRSNAGAAESEWRELEHASTMYGLSAGLRVPMLMKGFRAVFDAGFDYARIDTDGHQYQVMTAGALPSTGEGFSSSSLSVPIGFSVEKDFLLRWGVATPRLAGGCTYELSDTASGVRALHALSSTPLYYANGFSGTPSPFASVRAALFHVALGLDLRTVGGWDLGLDYRRDFASGYSRDNFKFELGRSF